MSEWLAALLLVSSAGCGDKYGAEVEIRHLFEALGSGRFVEGRPATAVAPDWYAPLAPPAEADLDRLAALVKVERRLRALADRSPSAEVLAAEGLCKLARERFDDAIVRFQAAADRAGDDPSPHSDLALAYLARAEHLERPLDLVLALKASEVALEIDPSSAQALFNRALVLSKLGLRTLAVEVWNRFLTVENDRRWQEEARSRLAALQAPSLADRWSAARDSLGLPSSAPDERGIVSLVTRFPFKARLYGEEELLQQWAEAALTCAPEADAALTTARALGAALARLRGSNMLADAVATIDRAAHSPDTAVLAALRRGHRAFARGLAAYEVQDFESAEKALVEAIDHLAPAGSPLAHWAEFYLGICVYYGDRFAGAERFERLQREADVERYPALRGRIHWLLGTIAVSQRQPEAGLLHYHQAMSALESSSGPAGAAFVHVLIAEAYAPIGEVERGWRHRLAALSGLWNAGNLRRLNVALHEAAQALLRQGHGQQALLFLDELLTQADAWGNPGGRAEALLQRARVWIELGDFPRARADLAAAQAAFDQLPPNAFRADRRLSVRLEEGRVLAHEDPASAISELTDVLAGQDAIGYGFNRIILLTARARAHLALGDRPAAEADLLRSIEAYEKLRATVGDEHLRRTAFSQAQPAFDALLRLRIESGAADAFAVAERSRSRFLLDLRQEGPRDGAVEPVTSEALAALPADTALVLYAVLEQRLLAWVARGGSLKMTDVAVTAERLAALTRKLRHEIERAASTRSVRATATALHEVLLTPLETEIGDADHLVFVPDRFLQQVPFAALASPAGRFLIEDRTIAIAPSATLLTISLQHARRLGTSDAPRVLVVGEPAIDRGAFSGLPPLTGAEQEAIGVASLYAGSVYLSGAGATEEAFLGQALGFDVVHFAGHAQTNPDATRLSRLLMAPSDSDDGVLHAHELYRRHFEETRLLVLSACRTLDSSRGDREGLMGLAGVFLGTGVPAVVASLWDTDDFGTRALMLAFHRRIAAGSEPAAALRGAALELLAGEDPRLREPRVWAAFEVVGGGRYRDA